MVKFKPLIDKLFWIISIPTLVFLAVVTTIVFIFPASAAIIIIILADLATVYFLISPLFGYVELRESTLFIKYGFLIKREIPYDKIRDTVKEHRFISESMLSLKNAFEHVNIKYNTFDVTTVSVTDNDAFIAELKARINDSFDNEAK